MTDEELNEKFDHFNGLLQGLATQLNTMTIRASVVAVGQPNRDGHYNPDGMQGLVEAMKGTAAYSVIPAGQTQTPSTAIIKKDGSWDYSVGRKVTITCANWGPNQQRTITKALVNGNYVSLFFNAPLGLPLAENDKIYPLPW